MLQSIHKHMKWIMWAIVILVTVTFMFFGIYPSAVSGRTVAKVDGYVISSDDLNRVYRNMEDNYRQIMKDQFNQDFAKVLRTQALRELVQDRLLVQEADRVGLRVTDEELQSSIMQIPAFLGRGGFDKRAYEDTLRLNNITPAQFEASQRNLLLRQKLERLVEDGVAVSDAELPAAYASRNPKARPGDFEKNKITFKQTYLAEKQRIALDAFVKGLANKATIQIDDKALAS
jgi:peptidyl-prolyl cis-trans isomerase D